MFGFIKDKIGIGDGSAKHKRLSSKPPPHSTNTITEIQILEGHTDIVRVLLRIDELRICSGSDDGLLITWNRSTGQRLMDMKGHTLGITCLLLLERAKMVSGSADKTIRIWNLYNGECLHVLKGHTASVKCIVALPGEKFCSGANDRQLYIWSFDGVQVNQIERQEEENLHCMLPISENRLITASNSSLLLVYRIDTCQFVKVLAYHRESVRCLVRISSSLFASASMDGGIIVWQTDTLIPLKVLFNPDKYKNDDRVYVYNVKYLLALGEKYLVAAIGHGFRIYDVLTGDCIVDCKSAHEAEVNHIIALYDGTKLATCSADSCIRLWGTNQKINFKRKEKSTSLDSKKQSSLSKVNPVCLGEMWGHADAVNQLLQLTENSFVSCSHDGAVILWKDGLVESDCRNRYAGMVLQEEYERMKVAHETLTSRPKQPNDSPGIKIAPKLKSHTVLRSSDYEESSEGSVESTSSGRDFPRSKERNRLQFEMPKEGSPAPATPDFNHQNHSRAFQRNGVNDITQVYEDKAAGEEPKNIAPEQHHSPEPPAKDHKDDVTDQQKKEEEELYSIIANPTLSGDSLANGSYDAIDLKL